MPSVTEFYDGPTWQQSSEPFVSMDVQESDLWPVDDRAEAAKDTISEGEHPVVAVGLPSDASRSLQRTGVVVSINVSTAGTATDRIVLNIADGVIVRQYVSNIATYLGGASNTYVTAPFVGLPVYVDDSADLSEGVTLSMSRLNYAAAENPLAGYLTYCQNQIADGQVGGARATATFDIALPNEATEQIYCVQLTSAKHLESA